MPKFIQNELHDLRTKLNKDGYVIIDFLNDDKLNQISNYITSISKDINPYFENGIHMTIWIDNMQLKSAIKSKLNEFITDECNRLFKDFKLLNTTLIVKNKHKVSNFPLHQDWSFIDETKNAALNLWIALQDTNEKNGGLFVIKGTHKLNNYVRGSGKLFPNFEGIRKKLNKYLTPIKLKAGQAILFHYSLIHGSAPNLSNQSRMAVSTTVLSRETSFIINHYDELNSQLKQFQVGDDFIYNYQDIKKDSNSIPTGGVLVNTIENYIPKSITINDIDKVVIHDNKTFSFRNFLKDKSISLWK